jgi:hypothetical protein
MHRHRHGHRQHHRQHSQHSQHSPRSTRQHSCPFPAAMHSPANGTSRAAVTSGCVSGHLPWPSALAVCPGHAPSIVAARELGRVECGLGRGCCALLRSATRCHKAGLHAGPARCAGCYFGPAAGLCVSWACSQSSAAAASGLRRWLASPAVPWPGTPGARQPAVACSCVCSGVAQVPRRRQILLT